MTNRPEKSGGDWRSCCSIRGCWDADFTVSICSCCPAPPQTLWCSLMRPCFKPRARPERARHLCLAGASLVWTWAALTTHWGCLLPPPSTEFNGTLPQSHPVILCSVISAGWSFSSSPLRLYVYLRVNWMSGWCSGEGFPAAAHAGCGAGDLRQWKRSW